MKRLILAGLLMGAAAAPALGQSQDVAAVPNGGTASGDSVGQNLVDSITENVRGVARAPRTGETENIAGPDFGPAGDPRLDAPATSDATPSVRRRINSKVNPFQCLPPW